MFVSHTVRRGNMTILAINMTMYDVDSRKLKQESLGFRIRKMV